MGRRKYKGVYERKSFETLKPGQSDTSNEPYAALYVTMITSGAYRNLSHGARDLYTVMKLQYLSKQNGKAGLQPEQFYFNNAMQKKFGFTNKTQFIKWREELKENGFIDIVECGRTTRTKSIYAFSDRWHAVEYREKVQKAGTQKLKELHEQMKGNV